MTGVPTKIWKLEGHSAAKHDILRRYLHGWLPILATTQERVLYIDGFAGPGEYEGGVPGSPLVALDACVNHVLKPKVGVGFFFIEENKDRADHLRGVLARDYPASKMPLAWTHEVVDGSCSDRLTEAFDHLDANHKRLRPTLAFLDPFGYSQVPMDVVGRILKHAKCEVLITFMAGFAYRFVDTGLHDQALRTLFGNDEWRGATDIEGDAARCAFLLDIYVRQLKAKGAKHVRSFEMVGENGKIIYYLVYATGHAKGMEVMKEAMWKVDGRGTFRFSDRTDTGQSFLFDYADEAHWGPRAMQLVADHFGGKTVSLDKVHEWVVTETPYVFRKKPILAAADKAGLIVDVQGRTRAGSFPDGCTITFAPKKPKQAPLLA